MPLTQEEKQILDRDWISGSKRLHLVSHAEIQKSFSDALTALVGGHYSVDITGWSIAKNHFGILEKIEMSAVITSHFPEKDAD